MIFEPVLTPHGVLALGQTGEPLTLTLEPARGARLERAFGRGSGHGLLCLGIDEVGTALPAVLSYWRELGARYVTALCALPDIAEAGGKPPVPTPSDSELDRMAAAVPPMTGAEYLTSAVLADLWHAMDAAFDAELAQVKVSVQAFLKSRHPAWNLVGRVHFNLAENRKDEDAPFAFLATYTTRLSAQAKAQHLPLGKALQEYAGAKNRERLLSLLMPVQRAAEHCAWLKAMVDAGEIFHPLRWRPPQALQFLKDVPALESAGIIVRMPATWRMNRPTRPQVKATVGGNAPSGLGLDALLDFQMDVTLDGESLSRGRDQAAAGTIGRAGADPRQVGRGRPRTTEPDARAVQGGRAARRRRRPVVRRSHAHAGRRRHHRRRRRDAHRHRLERDRRRSLAGAKPWPPCVVPTGSRGSSPGRRCRATLRPYQHAGVQWLHLFTRLRLGACLADDMGLGKTIQVLVAAAGAEKPGGRRAQAEPARGAGLAARQLGRGDRAVRAKPEGAHRRIHPRRRPRSSKLDGTDDLADVDLVITSYGFLARAPWLETTQWRLVVLDEAQAIKNPGDQADPIGQEASGRDAHRPDRHADREPARRPVVDLRLHQSRTAGIVQGSSRPSSSSSPSAPTIPTGRCATWCAPTSCAA